MVSKRSRIGRSSSQGEIGLDTQIKCLELSVPLWQPPKPNRPHQKPNVKQLKQQPRTQPPPQPQPRRSIFTLDSTIGEMSDVVFKKPQEVGFGAFLKCCSLCKKELEQDKNVYMYGYLLAFCSPGCRDGQMALDGFDKQCVKAKKLAKGWEEQLEKLGK